MNRPAPVLFALITVWACLVPSAAWAVDEFKDLVRIEELPKSELEIQRVFRQTRGSGCELIAAGQPLEVRSYTSVLTTLDRRKAEDTRLIPSKRQNLFTVGLEFTTSDRADLPALSRSQILDYVEKNFVSVQARVRRDLLDRKPYFHHRPIAVTASYRGSRLSQAFEPIIATTIRDFHGLGLFVEDADDPIENAEMFRTMVLLFRSPMFKGSRVVDVHEYVFIRGVEDGIGNLEAHCFCTSGERETLYYMRDSERPTRSNSTSILGRIAITKFDSSGLYPKSSATRSHRVSAKRSFTMQELDEYCEAKGLEGGFGENVTTILDAIISRQLVPKED